MYSSYGRGRPLGPGWVGVPLSKLPRLSHLGLTLPEKSCGASWGMPWAVLIVVVSRGRHVPNPRCGHIRSSASRPCPWSWAADSAFPTSVGLWGGAGFGNPGWSRPPRSEHLLTGSGLPSPYPWHFGVLPGLGSLGSLRPLSRLPPGPPQSACGRRPPEAGQSLRW